jgi:hypothetical protein
MRFHRPSTDRSAAFRSYALSFAKSCSIGLKSGERAAGKAAVRLRLRSLREPRHVGDGAGFVNEDQALRVELGSIVSPCRPPRGDVRPILLVGTNAFF